MKAAEKYLLLMFPVVDTLHDYLERKGESLKNGKEVNAGGGCGHIC